MPEDSNATSTPDTKSSTAKEEVPLWFRLLPALFFVLWFFGAFGLQTVGRVADNLRDSVRAKLAASLFEQKQPAAATTPADIEERYNKLYGGMNQGNAVNNAIGSR